MRELKLQTELIGDAVVLHVSGTIEGPDAHTLQAELDRLLKEGHYRLIVELGHMSFGSDAWLGRLVSAWKAASARGGYLRIANPPPQAEEFLQVCGFDKLMGIYSTVDDALEAD